MNTKLTGEPEFDPELLKMYLKLTPEERLKRMYELNEFFREATPEKNKQAWKKLKQKGW